MKLLSYIGLSYSIIILSSADAEPFGFAVKYWLVATPNSSAGTKLHRSVGTKLFRESWINDGKWAEAYYGRCNGPAITFRILRHWKETASNSTQDCRDLIGSKCHHQELIVCSVSAPYLVLTSMTKIPRLSRLAGNFVGTNLHHLLKPGTHLNHLIYFVSFLVFLLLSEVQISLTWRAFSCNLRWWGKVPNVKQYCRNHYGLMILFNKSEVVNFIPGEIMRQGPRHSLTAHIALESQ